MEARAGVLCHYCATAYAVTEVYVLPQALRYLAPSDPAGNFQARVPSCYTCSGVKGELLASCTCPLCVEVLRSLLAVLGNVPRPARVNVAARSASRQSGVACGTGESILPGARERRLVGRVKDRDGDACHYCGRSSGTELVRVVPSYMGGPRRDVDNLVLSCQICAPSRVGEVRVHDGCTFCASAVEAFPVDVALTERLAEARAKRKSSRPRVTNRECHYCHRPADCLVAIVPRRLRNGGGNPRGIPVSLPTCSRCQDLKGANRAACTCTLCVQAWTLLSDTEAGAERVIEVDVAAAAAAQDVGLALSPMDEVKLTATDGGRAWFYGDFGGIRALIAERGHACHYCDDTSTRLTVEHVVPRSLGGPWWVDNLVPACEPCNTTRSNLNADHLGCGFCARAREMYPAQGVVAASPLTPGT